MWPGWPRPGTKPVLPARSREEAELDGVGCIQRLQTLPLAVDFGLVHGKLCFVKPDEPVSFRRVVPKCLGLAVDVCRELGLTVKVCRELGLMVDVCRDLGRVRYWGRAAGGRKRKRSVMPVQWILGGVFAGERVPGHPGRVRHVPVSLAHGWCRARRSPRPPFSPDQAGGCEL